MKSKFLYSVIVLLAICTFSPAAWSWMPTRWQVFEELSDQTIPSPTDETAVVVFVLLTDAEDVVGTILFGGALKNYSLIYDVTSETPKLLGTIQRGVKFAYEVPTGKYILQSKNLLEINVVAGRTYFVHVDDPGILFGGIDTRLYPVRNGSEGKFQYSSDSFQQALKKTVLVNTHPVAQEYWVKEKWLKVENNNKKQLLKKWEAKSESERQEFTMNPEDGVLPGYQTVKNSQTARSDISASSLEQSSDTSISLSPSNMEKLKTLEALRDDGLFTEEEFQRQKSMLLEKKPQ